MVVRHLQNLLARILADELRMVSGEVRLHVLDDRVVGLAFHIHTAWTMDDFHDSLLCSVEAWTLPTHRGVTIQR
jgi:hypothetical protein